MRKLNQHTAQSSILKRLLFLLFILVTIPFVTKTFPFLANNNVEISLIIETDLESETSEFNDLDDDFFPAFESNLFASENCSACPNCLIKSPFDLHFENTTPPPECC